MNAQSKTIYAKKEWFEYLQNNCLGSSGYRGSLAGLRRSCWGKDALVVRCCKYLFRVDEKTFNYVSSNA